MATKSNPMQDLLDRTANAGLDQMLLTQKAARTWVMKEIDKLQIKVDPKEMLNAYPAQLRWRIVPGYMYMFMYDAKHKDKLPYWDRFPLIFPIETYDDGFLGINLHYLDPVNRAKLFDALLTLAFSNKYDETMRLRVSYDILKSSARFKNFKPCIKRYLYSHVRSKYFVIEPNQWTLALFMPTARFQKSSDQQVWSDSRQIIKKATKKAPRHQ